MSKPLAHPAPREYSVLDVNPGAWNTRLLIGTPMTGLVRAEWVQARYGQAIPTNWGYQESWMGVANYGPMKYLVADAQNLICKYFVENDFEWLFLLERDNVIPRDCFVRLNDYMRKCEVPIVSGLYFTRSVPPEPLIYRGRGSSHYIHWKLGDKVWCDGVPTGTLLVHGSIIKAVWNESPEYNCNGQVTRRVFANVENVNLEGPLLLEGGTSDLHFCDRLIREKFFEKAGWPEYQKMKFPLLVDTNLYGTHIEDDGRQFPLGGIPKQFLPVPPKPERQNGSLKGLAGTDSRSGANASRARKPSRSKSRA